MVERTMKTQIIWSASQAETSIEYGRGEDNKNKINKLEIKNQVQWMSQRKTIPRTHRHVWEEKCMSSLKQSLTFQNTTNTQRKQKV